MKTTKMYKLINLQTKEETICTKVVVDGFHYYVSDEIIKDVRPYKDRWQIEKGYILNKFPTYLTDLSECRLVIATNNPSIDVLQVVNEVEVFAEKSSELQEGTYTSQHKVTYKHGYIDGYNTHAETHTLTDDEVFDFSLWFKDKIYINENETFELWENDEWVVKTKKELLLLFKEQQVKTIYYGNK